MKSYVNGLSDEPLRFETIPEALKATVSAHSDKIALSIPYQGIRWTWCEFSRQVDEFAAGLMSLGFKTGDRLGIWSPNGWEWTVTQFATARLGVILVCINPAYRIAELEFALNKVGCRGIVLAEKFKTSDYLQLLDTLIPELSKCQPGALRSESVPCLEHVIRMGADRSPGMFNVADVKAKANAELIAQVDEISASLQPDDPINIQFTSGTTGLPKAATLSHFNILNNGYLVGKTIALQPKDKVCIPVPLYHCFGMVMGNLACVAHGATMVYPAPVFEAEITLKTVQEEKCTALYGVPTMFIAQLDHPEFSSYDVSSLRTGIMAGSLCPIEVMKRVIAEMNMSEVTIAYGMTETSPVSFQSSIDDSVELRVTTVGRIHPHVEVKIVDEGGHVVERGVQGELRTRGYCVMRGYWGDPERTTETIDDAGWLKTGDLATIDENGYCRITGRVKDMVIRGGENVYPREIEEFLYRHSDIQDVQVFGVPDERFGEELCAWIKLKSGTHLTDEDIRDFCKDQIAYYKVPRYIQFVDEYPMTVTGKHQKFKMRDAMIEQLELS